MHKQQSLFADEQPWEIAEASSVVLASVVFAEGLTEVLDYSVPENLAGLVVPGKRLQVPLGRGNRPALAYCVNVHVGNAVGRAYKHVLRVLDDEPLLSLSMLRLTESLAERYLCSWGQVLESVIPAGVKNHAGQRLRTLLHLNPEPPQDAPVNGLPRVQRKIVLHLQQQPEPVTAEDLALAVPASDGPIQELRKKGWLLATRVMQQVAAFPDKPPEAHPPHALNQDQQRALDLILAAMRAGQHETILLHGVTGSGKTEVYLQAINEVVRYGKQSIVLVPEISLTPQTQGRIRSRFPHVAILHSMLSDAERHWHWRQAARGAVSVVVGARSAVFAPVPNLGLIILDEEHEGTFKQESAPRYHAREVALARAKEAGAPLVLASATPSLESWHAALTGEFKIASLPQRVSGRRLPKIEVVDLRAVDTRFEPVLGLSRKLEHAMHEALDDGGQVILLLNRRGYSTHIQCPACGTVVRCPDCDIALVHHKDQATVQCHYCNFKMAPPPKCPSCGFAGIHYRGLGTQRLEAEVRSKFKAHPLARMDTDTMKKPGSHEAELNRFASGETRILLGTQMIAKGLDFPQVTLVGVISADIALQLPDFRASERTFQLLVQVAGRTGRGDKGGRVLIQTLSAENPAIEAASRYDITGFTQAELAVRKAHGYPPFANLIRLVFRGQSEPQVREFARTWAEVLETAIAGQPGGRVLGPAPAPFVRLQGRYRYHIQVHSEAARPLRDAVRKVGGQLATPDGIEWIADVDPLSML